MNIKEDYENLKAFDEGVMEFLKSRPNNKLTESSINKILHYIHGKNYLQVFYSYGLGILRDLLAYFTDIENYEQCILIRDTVLKHNKATGSNFKLI